MADRLVIVAIIAFTFLGIVGIAQMFNPQANSIPPTNAYSRIIAHSGLYDAETYQDSIRMDWPYAQISDSTTQGTTMGSAVNVTLNTNDSIYHITHSTTTRTNEIIIQEPGVYQIIAVPQVGESGSQASGVHDFWIMKNNIKIPNSNIQTMIMLQLVEGDTMTATLNWVGYLNSNDIVSFQQGSTDSDIGIVAMASGVPPATPSVVISIAKIGY